jgi:hypothetical protein
MQPAAITSKLTPKQMLLPILFEEEIRGVPQLPKIENLL